MHVCVCRCVFVCVFVHCSYLCTGSFIRSVSMKSRSRKSWTSSSFSGPPMFSMRIPVLGFLQTQQVSHHHCMKLHWQKTFVIGLDRLRSNENYTGLDSYWFKSSTWRSRRKLQEWVSVSDLAELTLWWRDHQTHLQCFKWMRTVWTETTSLNMQRNTGKETHFRVCSSRIEDAASKSIKDVTEHLELSLKERFSSSFPDVHKTVRFKSLWWSGCEHRTTVWEEHEWTRVNTANGFISHWWRCSTLTANLHKLTIWVHFWLSNICLHLPRNQLFHLTFDSRCLGLKSVLHFCLKYLSFMESTSRQRLGSLVYEATDACFNAFYLRETIKQHLSLEVNFSEWLCSEI